MEHALDHWRAVHEDSDLLAIDRDGVLTVWDTRGGVAPDDTRLTGVQRELYLACDRCCSAHELATTIGRSLGTTLDLDMVQAELAPLVDAGLVMTDGRRYLALARLLGDRRLPRKFLVQLAIGIGRERTGVT